LVNLLVLPGCKQQPSARAGDAVATVGGTPITRARLETEIRRRSGMGGGAVDPEKVLAALIDQEAAYAQAVASGFTEKPEIQQAMRLFVAGRYRESRESDLAGGSAVTEERARLLYAANTNRLVRPLAVNLALLRVECPRKATDEKRAEAMTRAVALRARAATEVKGLAHFGPLAAEASADQATRYRGGETGWLTIEQLQSRFADTVVQAALALAQPGELSEPIAAPDGIYLLKLMSRRSAQLRPFDEVRPMIEHELAQEARTEREARWSRLSRQGVPIQIHREPLDQLRVLPVGTNPPSPPPAMTGG
jgi:parvulin-like peptidyl-prolyl isomerase